MKRAGLLKIAPLALLAWTGLTALAAADDWVVERLRGEVLVSIDGVWQPLTRGDVVSDSSPIKSLENSRVTFQRGAEAIELSGATEIRIFDQQGQRMTTVMQAYGTVTVEAERLQVQHFSIQTPYLAAIVKGTRFTVHSDDGQSTVEVSRGLVQVQDYVHGVATDITPGQSALVSPDVVLDVSGSGAHAPIVTLDGQIVAAASGAAADQPVVIAAPDSNSTSSDSTANNGNGNAYGQDNGNSGSGNSGSGGNSNAYGHDNDNSGNGNAGGNDNSGHGNSGNGNSGNGNSGNGNNGNGNAYGHDKDNSGKGNSEDKPGNGHGRDK